jgi:hypothetical protein
VRRRVRTDNEHLIFVRGPIAQLGGTSEELFRSFSPTYSLPPHPPATYNVAPSSRVDSLSWNNVRVRVRVPCIFGGSWSTGTRCLRALFSLFPFRRSILVLTRRAPMAGGSISSIPFAILAFSCPSYKDDDSRSSGKLTSP